MIDKRGNLEYTNPFIERLSSFSKQRKLAAVVKLADTLRSGRSERKLLGVRVSPAAPQNESNRRPACASAHKRLDVYLYTPRRLFASSTSHPIQFDSFCLTGTMHT